MTALKQYINVSRPEELVDFAKDVARKRLEDIANFNNLPNLFMAGRKVGKVPTGSADVTPSDRIGDFNYTTSYLYICVDNSGTAAWRRVALGSW
jgi:hypothetical protein